MIRQPPRSRNRLDWYRFEQAEDGGWELVLPDFYAALFEQQETCLIDKSDGGFRPSLDHAGQRTCFAELTPEEVIGVKQFVEDYQRHVVLGLSRRLKPHFTDELDLCVALDYNAESPEDLRQNRRTPIGQLEYRAKYEQSSRAVAIIAEQIAVLLGRIRRGLPSREVCLSYVPAWSRKKDYLPRELVRVLVSKAGLGRPDDSCPVVVHSGLNVDKPSMKLVSLRSKLTYWRTLERDNAISLSDSVDGKTVVVVDDLYQSGATLWSYARYLKSQRASVVVGVVCVKSWRDTDNL